jgi:type I restriction enzyme S subunit
MTAVWPTAKLGAVLASVDRAEVPAAGVAYRQIGVRLWGEGAHEREALDGGATKYSRLKRVEAGDIIVNKIWARNGSVAVVRDELAGCYASAEFPTYVARPGRLDPRWFHWIAKTRWFWKLCDEASHGTSGKNRIRPEKFLAIEIPLPPLEEQRRIVAKLDALVRHAAAVGDALEHNSKATNALLRSTLHSVFAGHSGWPEIRLEDACETILDCLHSNPVYSEQGVPTVRSPDVGLGTLYLGGAKRTSDAEYRRRTSRGEPQEDDLVIVREGGGTGRAALVRRDERFSLGQRVMLLRPRRQRVLPRFLLHQWLSPRILDAEIAEKTKGSASPHLNISHVRRFSLLMPSLEEQKTIVDYLDRLQGKIHQLGAIRADAQGELSTLVPALLDRAFRGEL